MSKPAPRSASIINILLFACLAFLGYQIIMGPAQAVNSDPRTATDVLAKMKENAANLKDISVQKDWSIYNSKMRQEAKKSGLTDQQIREKEMASLLLMADAKLKSGLYRIQVDTGNRDHAWTKMSRAYDLIKPTFETQHSQPIWKQKFPVVPAPSLGLPETERSMDDVYQDLVRHLSAESKTHLVFYAFQGYWLTDFLVKLTGSVPGFSYWFAGLLLAVFVRLIVWPLAHRQYMWGRQMGQLQPFIAEIKDKFTDPKTKQIKDPAAFQTETMKLYKEYGINPLAGCGPALIQVPLFLLVYQCMLLYKFEFTKGTFLWMQPGATSFLGIPLAPNLGERDYIIIAIYGISMVVATLLQPVSDPANAKQSRMIGIGISVLFSIMMFFWPIPSAFVVYWVFTNIIATSQSLWAYSRPLPPLTKVSSVKGGKIPTDTVARPGQQVDPAFFGKTGVPQTKKAKKKK